MEVLEAIKKVVARLFIGLRWRWSAGTYEMNVTKEMQVKLTSVDIRGRRPLDIDIIFSGNA